MASPCEVMLPYIDSNKDDVQRVAQAAEEEVRRIETKYSRFRPDSILSKINSSDGQKTTIDAETHYLLNYASVAFELSDGLFDITAGVLSKLWDFRNGIIPSPETIRTNLAYVGFQHIRFNSNSIILPAGMSLDFGGIGKEYAVDCAAAICKSAGITHGIVDLGGDLHVIGPQPDNRPWKVGVRNPRAPENAIAELAITQGGLSTSGDYERYFEHSGKRYCHLLLPKTGMPVSYWASVSVVAPSCLLAGTLSTIAMLKQSDARMWLDEQEIQYLGIHPDLTMIERNPCG
ncbi:MAG: FAD:protein FMN transferase [Thalassolituus oleivorans]|uniref:FAD:protein FMN transferase n=1 Tax=Thalassolituus oleivorans TaxID=187493 RepID=UPI001B77F48F|nr:FAD:protein FMN transferase [Thalassolituus oleivorans]MBQ0726910.1 FAD:protein FMN transferase [Thalassolituus oleivorans]MBQ0782383.1 FAD:protein FMN transferase [Thalassolituus oleivorans]